MKPNDPPYVPALGYGFLTALYDPVVALTTRERTFKERLILQAEIRTGHVALDVGCGTGTLAMWIKQACPGAIVSGIDGDDNVLGRARRKAARAGLDIQFDRGLSYALPYLQCTFDRVMSSLFFHHLTHDAKMRTFAEIHRVLKGGGELHVADWGRPSNPLMRVLSCTIQVLDGPATTRDNMAGRLPQMLSDCGFAYVSERGVLATMFGTLSFYSAQRPA